MANLLVGPSRTYTTVQAAINAAVAGDVCVLDAGVLFTECLTMPNKGALASDIVITTNASAGSLPAADTRTNPSYASFLPKIQSTGGGTTTVQFAAGANHYTFRHIEFPEVPAGFNSIISIGAGGSTQQFYADEPHHVTIDQCYLHGGLVCGQKRGIDCHGRYITITNNYFENIKSVGQDSQCIGGFNGHGPLTVLNNRLSGGTEPLIMGGGDPWVRTFMTITGTPTATGASVTCADAGHTLSELVVGQAISVSVAGVYTFSTISTITGTGASGSITFASVGATPDTGTVIKAGVVLGMEGAGFGLTFRRNLIEQDPAWQAGNLPMPTGVSAVGSTASGALAAGTHYYTVQAYSDKGYQYNPTNFVNSAESAEVSATIGATGKVTISWTLVPGATIYRVWHGATPGARTKYHDSVASPYVDDGTAMTVTTPGPATFHQIKNLFELKACQNAQIDSNIFQYNWKGTGQGLAWWIKSVNQDGEAPYVQSKNIVFEKNVIRHCTGWLNIHGRERGQPTYPWTGPLTNLSIRENLVYDSGPNWSISELYATSISEGVVNFTIDHNTVAHITNGTGGGLMALDSSQLTPMVNLIIKNNMMRVETFGIKNQAGGSAIGTASLAAATTSYTLTKNDLAGGTSGAYGATNFFETNSAFQGEFVSYSTVDASADYHLVPASPYKLAGTDGRDLGPDMDALYLAVTGVDTGAPETPPPPPPLTSDSREWFGSRLGGKFFSR